MDKQQARQIIKDTFESSFDKVRFTNFIKNLLNSIECKLRLSCDPTTVDNIAEGRLSFKWSVMV